MAETDKTVKETVYLNPSRFELYCDKLHINPNLFMLKVTLFMMYGATGSLLPFLTIHMQSIGLTVEEIAIIYLALPLTTFLSPPVTGFLVDKFGHYKPVVLISLILNMVFHHALMMIPQKEIPGEIPSAYVMRHPNTTKVEVWWSPCPSRECPDDEKLSLVLHECLDHCLLLPQKNETNTMLKGVHESIAARPPTILCPGDGASCKSPTSNGYSNEWQGSQFGKTTNNDLIFDLNRKKPKRNGTSTRKMKKVSNTTGIPLEVTNMSNIVIKEVHNSTTNYVNLWVNMHPSLMDPSENLGMEVEPDEEEEVTDFRQHFSRELLEEEGVNYTALEKEDLRCGGLIMSSNLTYDTLKELAADCMLQKCNFRAGGPEVCPPDYKQSSPHVFWIYFLLRFLGNTMMSASVTVMDPIALDMINRYGGEFGRERLFSTIGMAIFSPLTGVLIDYRSRKLGYTDYSAAFYIYDILILMSTLTLLLMRIGAKVPTDNIMRDMIRLIKLPHIIMFIFFLFALGNAWGFIESFLFLYLKELGAPNYLLGITVAVGTISSIPFLYGAESITRRIGHVNIIVVAFFAHAARLMGYSYIENAWWCFPFEAIESVSVHLLWVAAATYCARIAPKSLLATLIGVIGMAHFSLGRGSGSFAGGFLIGSFGIRQTFRLMGLMSVICGSIYGLLYFFWLHKYDSTSKEYTEGYTDQGEGEKLKKDESDKEAARKEQIRNAERLSLMIRFNHRGSLTSLDHGSRPDLRRTNSCRRGSTLELGRVSQSKANSSSKVDLLKSTLEINLHKNSNPQLNHKASPPPLTRHTTKVNNEPAVLNTPQTCRKSQKNAPPIVDELRNRRDSIPEEEEAGEELLMKTENIKANLKTSDDRPRDSIIKES